MEQFDFSNLQAQAILRMTLARLTNLERQKLVDELEELRAKIAEYKAILASEQRVLEVIIEELEFLKKRHAIPRRTEISAAAVEIEREELITPEDVVVTKTHGGYLKRTKLDTYSAQGRGGRGIRGADTREQDFVTHLWGAHTHDTLLFLTHEGRAFAKRVFEVPEGSRTSLGRSIQNLLNLREGEKVTAAFAIKEFDDRDILFCTRHGVVKKVTLSLLRNAARQTGIIACGLEEGDSLISATLLEGGEDVLLATRNGYSIRFNESDVRRMGRTARGVRGIKLRDGDEVIGSVVVEEGRTLLTACENGYGKRTGFEEYRVQSRGGMGIINIKTNQRNGPVVEVAAVLDDENVMLITAGGMIIRTRVGEISMIGRNTQGVRIIKLKSDDRLLAAAVVSGDEDEGDEPVDPDAPADAQEPQTDADGEPGDDESGA